MGLLGSTTAFQYYNEHHKFLGSEGTANGSIPRAVFTFPTDFTHTPATEADFIVTLNGEEQPRDNYVYDASAKTITFSKITANNVDTTLTNAGELLGSDVVIAQLLTQVLGDYRFYIISINMLAMPWIATGVFVYQSFIVNSKGWGEYTIAQSFMSYSICSVITLLVSGYLIDKLTSRKLLIYMNIPLLLATFVIMYFDASQSAFLFLGLIGISNGLANLLGSSTWAEIYGVKYIGSIKALTTALMVFATAFGTALFGILIDAGYSIEKIAIISAVSISCSIVLLFTVRKKLNPVYL